MGCRLHGGFPEEFTAQLGGAGQAGTLVCSVVLKLTEPFGPLFSRETITGEEMEAHKSKFSSLCPGCPRE